MSILIKGMEMPRGCTNCIFEKFFGYCGETRCCASEGKVLARNFEIAPECERPDWCPLIPVPPHGRLIDGDALLSRFEKEEKACDEHGREFSFSFISANEYCTEWWAVQRFLMDEMDAKTVIPAEGET